MEIEGGIDINTAAKGGFWIRLIAFVIDFIISGLGIAFLSLVAMPAIWLGSNRSMEEIENLAPDIGLIIVMFFVPFYFTFFTGYYGQTIGKVIFGLKVVRITGAPVGYARAFLRYLGFFISVWLTNLEYPYFEAQLKSIPYIIIGLGFAIIAVDRHKRGLHDLIAGTCVIKV